jgi:NADPH2:quinone reductase
MVSFGNSSGKVEPFWLAELTKRGSLYVTRPTLHDFIGERAALEAAAAELFELVESGRIKIEVRQTYPLRNAAQAHRDLEARRTTGSTVLTP